MPWVKLDDQFMRNPKVRAVSRDALAMHLAGFCYCATALSDGHIPDRDIPLVAAEALAPESSAGELGAVGLWERREGGWEIHDYLDYQPSREDVLEDRKKARDRKRAQREREKARHAVGHGGTDSVSHAAGSGGSPIPPVPSRPVLEDPSSFSGLTQYGLDPDVVWEHVAHFDLAAFEAKGGHVGNVDGWLRAARETAAARCGADAVKKVAGFQIDSEQMLAEVLVGKRRLQNHDRRTA